MPAITSYPASRHNVAFWTAAFGLVMARIALAMAAWEPGWSALSWDDFSRVAMAREWASAPQAVPNLVWLPFPTWVNGAIFRFFGGLTPDNPMLVTAIVNTSAHLGASVVVGWSAHRLFRSAVGSLLAFAMVLFAPWGFFTSLSGLVEPIYFLLVAVAVLATIAWIQDRRLGSLLIASLCVAAAATTRYEGWWLAASWAAVLGLVEIGFRGAGLAGRVRRAWRALAVLAVPALVPLTWILVNWHRTGDPLHFARESAGHFASAGGASLGLFARATYHPFALARSAPLMLVAIAVVAVVRHQDHNLRKLVAIIGLSFAALCVTSVLFNPVGAFNERFMFAFAVSLAPLLGGLPGVIEELAPRHWRAIGTAAALVVVVAVGVRISHPPTEWTYAPDLLTLTEALGRAADSTHPLTVVVGPGVSQEMVPLVTRNGGAIRVVDGSGLSTAGPPLDETTLWIERLPARVASISSLPLATIGRYAIYGDADITAVVCPGCSGWTLVDEFGTRREVPPGPYVPLEFTGDDPQSGAEALLETSVMRSRGPMAATLQLRSLYGHGLNTGRMALEVRIDGDVAFRRDIGARSRWLTIELTIPPGDGTSTIEVVVVALPPIESGWAWGRASTVLVRSFEVSGP